MRKLALGFLLTPLCTLANHFEVPAMGGYTFSKLENTRSITVYPDPAVINTYDSNDDWDNGFLAGLGLVYSFDHPHDQPFEYHLGLMGYFVHLGEVTGLKHPFVNGGNFDTLVYRFRVKSTAFMIQPRVVYTGYVLQPYGFVGLGFAENRAYDYLERPSNPAGSAAADPNPYRSHTMPSFAYEVGLGVQYLIPHKAHELKYLVSLDYRYMNLGEAALNTMHGQATDQAPEVENLYTQALVLAITTQF